MRIDFNAPFRELSKVIDRSSLGAPQNTAGTKASFGRLVDFLERKAVQLPEKTEPSKASPNPRADQLEFKGLLNLREAELEKPPLPKLSLNISSEPSVKTPTHISARRLEPASEIKASLKSGTSVDELISDAGSNYGIDPVLGQALALTESALNPKAVSNDGHASKGLFQLLDTTAKGIIEKEGLDQNYDPFNPQQNTELGIRHLRYLHDIFSQKTQITPSLTTVAAANSASLEKLALAAFNAGEGRVAHAQQRTLKAGSDPADFKAVAPYLPDSTREYVDKVLAKRDKLASESGS